MLYNYHIPSQIRQWFPFVPIKQGRIQLINGEILKKGPETTAILRKTI